MMLYYKHALAKAPLALSAVAMFLLLAAWTFQYGFGYDPCDLCMKQRMPYYAVVPLGLLVYWMETKAHRLAFWGLGLIVALYVVDAGIALHHAGIEYGWWEGKSACSSLKLEGDFDDMLKAIMKAPLARCDVAPWSLFGISMAGYNFLIATSMALFGLHALKARKA